MTVLYYIRTVLLVVLMYAFYLIPANAQQQDQVVRFGLTNRQLTGTTYSADIWAYMMPNKTWTICDVDIHLMFNRNALNGSYYNFEPLLNLDPELQTAGYTTVQAYNPTLRVLMIGLNPGSFITKSGGTSGSYFRLGTVRWQAIDLTAMDNIQFVQASSLFFRYDEQLQRCLPMSTSTEVNLWSQVSVYIQPWGCMPMYYDQPANCTNFLERVETSTPLSRVCPHWPPAPGPGIQPAHVYYQYDFVPASLPATLRSYNFNSNKLSGLLDQARCRWEAQIDQLTPPATNTFQWQPTVTGGRMFFTTDYQNIDEVMLYAGQFMAVTRLALYPNTLFYIKDTSSCGNGPSWHRRSEIIFNNAGEMYTQSPHYKWTTEIGGCGGTYGCLDFYSIGFHELGHYVGLEHQLRNHETVMGEATVWPMQTLMTDCDADNARRLYNSARIGYPIDNSFDCRSVTDVVMPEQFVQLSRIINNTDGDFVVYIVPTNGNTRIDIYNTMGQVVYPVFYGNQQTGQHTIELSTHSLPSGVYFVRIQTESSVENCKLLVLK